MLVYIHLGRITIAGYGTMMMLGFLIPTALSWFIIKKRKLEMMELLVLVGYGFIGALGGGKLLYLITVWNRIDWSWVFGSLSNFITFLGAGFVFYGGLIGTALIMLIPKFVHKIDVWAYLKYVGAPMIPIGHALGRVGCFFGGCCYGMEYDGPLAVTFPEGCAAPAGVPLFPSQLVEAACLLIIGLVNIFVIARIKDAKYTVPFYLITYGVVRFVLEFFRGDVIRGHMGALSTSQWIAIGWVLVTIAVMAVLEIRNRRRAKEPAEENKTEA